MDINVEIVKEELELTEPIVVKSENEYKDISNLDFKTEKDLNIEENQNGKAAKFVKEEPDHDNIERLKEEFISSEADETLFEIKSEELMVKSESESDDSKRGIHSEGDTDETHLCVGCDYETHSKNQLITHISVEHDQSMLKKYSYLSDFITNLRKSLDNHMQKHKYSCDHCEYKTYKNVYLKRHLLVKHYENVIKKYACDHCEYRTHNISHLKKHVMAKHDKNAIKKYGCHQCGYKTHYKSAFASHVLVKHDENAIKKHSCDHCEYKTFYKGALNKHLIRMHNVFGVH